MAQGDIKSRLVLEGEAEYKRQMTDAANAVKVLTSEQKLAEAQFEATGDAQQYASDKARILKEEIANQKKAVDAAEEAVRKLTENGFAENSKKMQDWKTNLNNAKRRLVVFQSQLAGVGKEFDNTDDKLDQNKLVKGIDFQNTIMAIDGITHAMENTVRMAARAAKGVWDLGVDASKKADEWLTKANELGVDVETYQSWVYASRFIDTSVEDITRSWQDIQKNLGGTNEEFLRTLAQMGVSVKDTGGKVRSASDIFWNAIDVLHRMTDETKRAQMADAVFGNDWRKLNPLIEAGSQGYRKMAEEGRQVAVVSEENVKALGNFNDQYEDMQARLEKLKIDTLSKLAPTFEKVAAALNDAITGLDKFVESEEGRAALEGLNEALGGLIDAFLGEDNGKQTFASIVNTAKEAVGGFTGALQWIKDNGDSVAGIIKAMAGAWVALKVTKGALEFLQVGKGALNVGKGAVNGTKNIFSRLFGAKGASAESLDDVAQSFNDAAERFNSTADAFESAADSAKASAEAAQSSADAAKSASESASTSSESASSSSKAAESSSKAAESASDTAESSASAAGSNAEAAGSSAKAAGESATAAGNSEAAAAASGDAAASSAAAAQDAAIASGSSATAAANSQAAAAASQDAAALSAGATDQAALAAGASAEAAASANLTAGSAAETAASSALTAGSAADASLSALSAAGNSVLASGNAANAAISSADAAASSALASGSALDAAISAAEAAATSIEAAANSAASAAESALGAAASRAALEAQLAGAAEAKALAQAAAAQAVSSARVAALQAGKATGTALLGGGGQGLLGSGSAPLGLPAGSSGTGGGITAPAIPSEFADIAKGFGALGLIYGASKYAYERRSGDQKLLVDTADHLNATAEADKELKAAFEEFVKTQADLDKASEDWTIPEDELNKIIDKANEASKSFLAMDGSAKLLDAYRTWRDGNAIKDWALPDDWEQLGLDAGGGLATGLNNSQEDVSEAGKALGQSAADAAMAALDEHSPSKVMEIIGGNAAVGLANGIYDRADEAIRAAQWLADQVAYTVQSALDIHSPSKVLERLGGYTAEGFARGLEEKIAAVERATSRMAAAATRPVMPNAYTPGQAGRGAPAQGVRAVIMMDKEIVGELVAPVVDGFIGAEIQARR